jgi:hypothetical protein
MSDAPVPPLTTDPVYVLELTPAELKVTWSALRSMDFGHDSADIVQIVRDVMAKMPSETDIHAIPLP